MHDSYRILLVEEDPSDADVLRAMLNEAEGFTFRVESAASLLDCLDCVGERHFDAILMGVALPDSRGLQALMTVRVYAPDTPMLVWTVVDKDPQLALAALHAGAQDYLVKDRMNGPALVRALQYAIMRHWRTSCGARAPESFSVGVLGAKGGVGTTVLACHLSAELRRATRSPVLLADLDLYGGQAAFLMKASANHTVIDAANNLHRLDDSYWTGLVGDGLEDVSVIRSPGLAALSESPSLPRRLRHVVRFLRTRYPWVVADLGRLSSVSIGLVKDLSYLLLVTTPDPQSLFETRQVMLKLAEAGVPQDRIRLVINKQAKDDAEVSSDVERVVGVPVYVLLDSGAALSHACERGRLLPERDVVRRSIMKLASDLAGVEAPMGKTSALDLLRECTAGLLQKRKPFPVRLQLPAPSQQG